MLCCVCRRAKRQVLDEECQRTSSTLPMVDVAWQRSREVAERKARGTVRLTAVTCGQRWTRDTLFFAAHFEIDV
jgi:hypothetical protein